VNRYPFLISIPHGGVEVPTEVGAEVALSKEELLYYSDPHTQTLFDFQYHVNAWIDTSITRLVVDVNRPPTALPPRHIDGVVKVRTIDGRAVFFEGRYPPIALIHQMMMQHYFPYHASLDRLLEETEVTIAFDCHSMLPETPPGQNDAGEIRPLICLGNHGDLEGEAMEGTLATCPSDWIQGLANAFREEFSFREEVSINKPFSGGFIANAHYWRKGIPWIQIEVNRALYEPKGRSPYSLLSMKKRIWSALRSFWETLP
jgi:N-formylglutamate deformylase